MSIVILRRESWNWILDCLSYLADATNGLSESERATLEAIKDQLDPKYIPPPRPATDDAVIALVVGRIEGGAKIRIGYARMRNGCTA